MQTQAWQHLRAYKKEIEESVTKRYLSGDEVKESERHQLIGLVKLFNHIEDAAKRVRERA